MNSISGAKILLIIVFVFVFLLFITSTTCCQRTCGSHQPCVPYPFGFSPDCPIQLNWTSSHGVQIGRFKVDKITSRGIAVHLPASCDLSVDSISPLFSDSYAVSWSSNLLLHNCSEKPNICSSENFFSRFGVDACGDKVNFSCFPSSGLRPHADAVSYQSVVSTTCKSLFSSFTAGEDDQSDSFVFQKVLLSWWLDGGCPNAACSKNSNCRTVNLEGGRSGFVCECKLGFIGDGFTDGEGCRRESRCNATKYVKGECRGKSRVPELLHGALIGASLMAILATSCFYYRRRSNSLKSRLRSRRLVSEAAGDLTVPLFQYKEIEKATNIFSEDLMLGTGAYGTVYAGKLNTGEQVAVKRIRRKDTDSIDQVLNEIKLLSSVKHPNLVRLLGCCIEEGEHILVYEFMSNGTLCQHLQKERGNGLPWSVRLAIVTETANAVAYLHSAMDPPIYHRDIKSSNILLDCNYNSKVADFGLSRQGTTEDLSHISTAPQGTPGYLDPQYHQYFHLSDKSDVYSFGVVLVEVITGLKVVDFSRSVSEVNLAALAVDRIRRGCVDEIIDAHIQTRDASTSSSIHAVAELAFRCLASHRDMRPTMTEVAEELEQIRASAYVSGVCVGSPVSLEYGGEKAGTRKLYSVRRKVENLEPLDEVEDTCPVLTRDLLRSQSSPPTHTSVKVIR